MKFMRLSILIGMAILLVGCDPAKPSTSQRSEPALSPPSSEPVAQQEKQKKPESPLITAARSQIGKTIYYDGAYVGLEYPGGDLPIETGVCTDVVIRALRDAFNMDLQKLVHEDMTIAFSSYPQRWGLKKPDRNIDHRRVPNLMEYFTRQGYSIAITQRAEDYLPGDLVTCMVGGNLTHIMVVSDRQSSDGVPLVIHNIGRGTVEENRLFAFSITGHYRIRQ